MTYTNKNIVSPQLRAAVKIVPTDQIKMAYEDVHDLIMLVEDAGRSAGKPVSADIVWAETIPLEHFVLIVEHPASSNLYSIEYKFDIIEDKVITDDGLMFFGAMTVTLHTRNQGDIEVCGPMICTDEAFAESRLVEYVKYQGRNFPIDLVPAEWLLELRERMANAMHMFYAVEVALLNPVVETVFAESASTVPLEPTTTKPAGKNKRAKIKYIKRHFLRMTAVSTALEKRGFVRHTNLWYVTGHWREYQNGKRTFIKGYWKGALRSLKDTETRRDREIVTEVSL